MVGFYRSYGCILISEGPKKTLSKHLFRFKTVEDIALLFILFAGTIWPCKRIDKFFMVSEGMKGLMTRILAEFCRGTAFKIGAEYIPVSRYKKTFRTNPTELQALLGATMPELLTSVSLSYRIPLAFCLECAGINEGPLGGPMEGV